MNLFIITLTENIDGKNNMKRRNFLGSLIALPAAVKATTITSGSGNEEIIKPVEPTISKWNNPESKLLSDEFFNYIHWNKTKFEWRQMPTPAYVIDGIPIIAKSRRLTPIIRGIFDECSDVRKKEVIKDLVKLIVIEMEEEYKMNKLKYFGFYNLYITSNIYDPDAFEPQRGVIIRYARISMDNWNENKFGKGNK